MRNFQKVFDREMVQKHTGLHVGENSRLNIIGCSVNIKYLQLISGIERLHRIKSSTHYLNEVLLLI